MRDFYKILVIGASGQGKSYAMENLPENTTGVINVEDKPLPIGKFKYHARPRTGAEVISTLVEYAKNPEITTIVFDSFSAYMEMVLSEARATKKGFDIWSEYNSIIGTFHSLLKKIQKDVIVTGHYEILNIEGAPEKRLKVQGKENEGQVERHYTMVLYADSKPGGENKRPQYFFRLFGEGLSAKCPPKIFGEDVFTIPNDYAFVVQKIKDYTKE